MSKQLTKSKLQKKLANKVGKVGEQQAASYLKTHNYQILATNYRFKHLEIDIIALDLSIDEIVFVEVKKRMSDKWGRAVEMVDGQKIKRLQVAAQAFLTKSNIKKLFRFDIIGLLPNNIEHLKNITAEF